MVAQKKGDPRIALSKDIDERMKSKKCNVLIDMKCLYMVLNSCTIFLLK